MSTTSAPFNWKGEYFHYRDVNIWPRPLQQPMPPVWMTGLSVETGKLAAERGHVVGTLLSGASAKPMFDAYRARAKELGWTAGPDRFGYACLIGVGHTREEGYRRANLIADYVRTSPIVAEPFVHPPGYISIGATVAMRDQETIVTSVPARRIAARPSGTNAASSPSGTSPRVQYSARCSR